MVCLWTPFMDSMVNRLINPHQSAACDRKYESVEDQHLHSTTSSGKSLGENFQNVWRLKRFKCGTVCTAHNTQHPKVSQNKAKNLWDLQDLDRETNCCPWATHLAYQRHVGWKCQGLKGRTDSTFVKYWCGELRWRLLLMVSFCAHHFLPFHSCSFSRSFFMVSFQTIYLSSLSNQERFLTASLFDVDQHARIGPAVSKIVQTETS